MIASQLVLGVLSVLGQVDLPEDIGIDPEPIGEPTASGCPAGSIELRQTNLGSSGMALQAHQTYCLVEDLELPTPWLPPFDSFGGTSCTTLNAPNQELLRIAGPGVRLLLNGHAIRADARAKEAEVAAISSVPGWQGPTEFFLEGGQGGRIIGFAWGVFLTRTSREERSIPHLRSVSNVTFVGNDVAVETCSANPGVTYIQGNRMWDNRVGVVTATGDGDTYVQNNSIVLSGQALDCLPNETSGEIHCRSDGMQLYPNYGGWQVPAPASRTIARGNEVVFTYPSGAVHERAGIAAYWATELSNNVITGLRRASDIGIRLTNDQPSPPIVLMTIRDNLIEAVRSSDAVGIELRKLNGFRAPLRQPIKLERNRLCRVGVGLLVGMNDDGESALTGNPTVIGSGADANTAWEVGMTVLDQRGRWPFAWPIQPWSIVLDESACP